jgi:hypothetical protein
MTAEFRMLRDLQGRPMPIAGDGIANSSHEGELHAMIVIGTWWMGAVDRVPGLCYVATNLAHVNYLPLLPLACFVVRAPYPGKPRVANN